MTAADICTLLLINHLKTALIMEQRRRSAVTSSFNSTSFPTDQPEQKKGGRKFWRSIRQKQSDLMKLEQRDGRERASVKKLLKGHSKAAEMVCGSVGWSQRLRSTSSLSIQDNVMDCSLEVRHPSPSTCRLDPSI